MRDIAGYLGAEFLAGDGGNLLAHALVGVGDITQACVKLFDDDDPAYCLHSLGVNTVNVDGSQ